MSFHTVWHNITALFSSNNLRASPICTTSLHVIYLHCSLHKYNKSFKFIFTQFLHRLTRHLITAILTGLSLHHLLNKNTWLYFIPFGLQPFLYECMSSSFNKWNLWGKKLWINTEENLCFPSSSNPKHFMVG